VDDLLIFSNHTQHIANLKSALAKQFGEMLFDQLSTSMSLSYIGLTISLSLNDRISVTQKGYCDQIIKEYEEFRKCTMRKYTTPSASTILDLRRAEVITSSIQKPFIRFTYCLLWIARMSHCELLFTVGIFATLCASPPVEAFNHMDRVFGYLSTVVDSPINLHASNLRISLYADASFALHKDGKSHSGFVIRIGDSTIHVSSEKQKFVTMSACEAETAAVVSADLKCIPINNLKLELSLSFGNEDTVILIHQDNQSAIRIISNGEGLGGNSRTFRVKYGYLSERIANKDVEIVYTSTNEMLADIPSKPANHTNFLTLLNKIKNII